MPSFMNMLAGFIGATLNPYATQNKENPIPITSVWFGTIRHKKKKCTSTWTATYTYNPWTREIQIHYDGKKYSPSGFGIAHYVAEQPMRTAAANGWIECEVFVENKWVPANYLREISPPLQSQPVSPDPETETNGTIDVEAELAKASIEDSDHETMVEDVQHRTPLVEYDSEPEEPIYERQLWIGTVADHHIKGRCVDQVTGKKYSAFKTLDDAKQKAEELGDDCGGITETSHGFTLRKGSKLHINTATQGKSAKNSWLKIN